MTAKGIQIPEMLAHKRKNLIFEQFFFLPRNLKEEMEIK